jgi:hypothetical protein
MIYSRPSITMCLRAALLMLMLSMQSFAFAHELDHGVTHDGTHCAVCSVSGALNAAVASDHDCLVDRVETVSVFCVCIRPVAEHTYLARQARAPPYSL